MRGQAKTKLIRLLTSLLDEHVPYIAGCEIRDNPFAPICRACRDLVREGRATTTPIAWLTREERYVEKLATPDVTIADMIGDIDPIKAARKGQNISDELTVHYGLLPRANRGIFAINELPDLAGKIQVGLFNIMQEGDVQIKGYPVRLPLDVMLVFTANPEDYTARGKIITPLKDRIGSEIRTHYPATLEHGMAITEQEAWLQRRTPVGVARPGLHPRGGGAACVFGARRQEGRQAFRREPAPAHFGARKRRLQRRAPRVGNAGESVAVPRVLDVYAALPSITGKLELEYEGELKGGDTVARELIRLAVGKVFTRYFDGENLTHVVQWFELGGSHEAGRDGVFGEDAGESWGRFRGCSRRPSGWAWARASPTPCAPARRSSSWKDCTRIAASAAMKKPGSPLRRAAESSRSRIRGTRATPVPERPRRITNEIGPLLPLHRRRLRPHRRGPDAARCRISFSRAASTTPTCSSAS